MKRIILNGAIQLNHVILQMPKLVHKENWIIPSIFSGRVSSASYLEHYMLTKWWRKCVKANNISIVDYI